MADSDDELFAQAMRGVRRLDHEPRRTPAPRLSAPRVAGAAARVEVEADGRSGAQPGPRRMPEPWVLRADGVSAERLRRLAAGRPPVEMEADLHGMSREQARAALERAIGEALASGRRVVCVVHGRGLHSRGGPVLREAVYRWLAEGPYAASVLAVIPKPKTRGGSCLVLLRRRR